MEELKIVLSYKALLGIVDGEAVESERIFSQNFFRCRFFKRSRVICEDGTSNLMNSQTGSFVSMFLTREGNDGTCVSSSEKVKEYAKRFSQGHCTFQGLGHEKKWYGTLS